MILVVNKRYKNQHLRKCRCNLKCYFCGGNHACRNCPIEKQIAPMLKKKVGSEMEHYVALNCSCPSCHKKKLHVIGNHSPSLDIICMNPECQRKFEIKSKCLSVNELPLDINMPHGNYIDYLNRQQSGLDFIIVIYKVNRKTKKIIIREVLYIDNDTIIRGDVVNVVKRMNSHLSTIKINNRLHNKIKRFNMKKWKNIEISFKNEVDQALQRLNCQL